MDDEIIKCWCGAEGTHEELFDETGLRSTCGGSGVYDCDGCVDCEDESEVWDDFDLEG